MFDSQLAAVTAARTSVEGVQACARLENSACAARLGHMADLLAAAQSADGSADREQWRLDNWSAVCAQIGAAHDVTSGVAHGLLTDAVVLRERLQKVAAVFAAGAISYRLVHLICTRTLLVRDPDALEALDEALAERVAACGAMSKDQAEKTIDTLVLTLDPFAVCRTQTKSRGHYVDVMVDDASGTAHVEAAVSVTDGHAFDQRVEALARTVCARDPRTKNGLRADAVGAMAFGWDRLPCLCESPDCDAASTPASGGIVIYLIAHQDTLDNRVNGSAPRPEAGGPSDDGEPAPDTETDADADDSLYESEDTPAESDTEVTPEPESDRTPAESDPDTAPDPKPTPEAPSDPEPKSEPDAAPVGDLSAQRRGLHGPPPPLLPEPWLTHTWSTLSAALNADRGEHCPARPGVLLGGAVVPAPVVAQAAMHATVRTLIHPGQAPPEPRYRPSKALAEFVKCRDQTCRFPGCNRPATVTEIDHTIPYPWGPTAASNLSCLCRQHHLLKTFWPGWSNRQYPDGTIVWTDPQGQTYTTHPGSRMLFPELSQPTAKITARGTPPPKHTAGLTMPRRTTTRSQARDQHITYQRRANKPLVAQRLRECLAPF